MPPAIPPAHKAPFIPTQIEAKQADAIHLEPTEITAPGRVRPLAGGLLVLQRQHTALAFFLPPAELRRAALQFLQLAEAADAREAEGARAAAVAGGDAPPEESPIKLVSS